MVGVKNITTPSFEIVIPMDHTDDKIEISKLNCCFKIFSVNNPSKNNPNLDLININRTVIIGDFSKLGL